MNNFEALESIENGKAILSVEEQKHISKVEDEHNLIAFVTPHLAPLAEELHLDMVNSEQFQWLSQSENVLSTHLKPDGFFTVQGLFEKKDDPQDSARMLRDNGFRYFLEFLFVICRILSSSSKENGR
jgi:hypothetical protein